jgi:hypothetical protein
MRHVVKKVLFAAFVLLASSSLAQQSVPDIQFDSVPDLRSAAQPSAAGKQ